MVGQRKYLWTSVVGKFDVSDTQIEFHGGKQDQDTASNRAAPPDDRSLPPLLGYIICSERFQEGRISVDVEFDPFDGDYPPIGEIILQYNPQTEELFNAGLGGVPKTFASVRAWTFPIAPVGEGSPKHWFNVDSKGDPTNLRTQKTYHVVVELRGSVLTLAVDGVEIIRKLIGQFVQPLQTGLLAATSSRVHFKNFVVSSVKPRAFVAMQFNTPAYEALYKDVIVPVCDSMGVEAYRASDTFQPGPVVADIARQIRESWLVIAEITPVNPNVFYEIGYADALGKPVILIANKEIQSLPFDVRAYRVLFYEDSIGGKDRVMQDLTRYLETMLQQSRPIPK